MKIFEKRKEGRERIIYVFGKKLFSYFRRSEYKHINFRAFESMALAIRQNVHKLPSDIDLIVGIPRSGIIPAYIVGLFLNKNVCSLNEFIHDLIPAKGERPVEKGVEKFSKHILLVDDSICSGKALAKVKNQLATGRFSNYRFTYCAVFAQKSSAHLADYVFSIVEQPRLFQWNYLNHRVAEECCFDIDGVLCEDPTLEQNDDGPKYLDFIKNAKPLFIPRYPICAVVTSRLEKYRAETENWLKKHGIKYRFLFMLNATAQERRSKGLHASFKAKIYKRLKGTVCFIESDPTQASEIAKLSGKQCICVSTDEYFSGKN